ncbi:MAG: ATPase, T2SS/T4P/T4SS family [Patescibacteria group bacterium]
MPKNDEDTQPDGAMPQDRTLPVEVGAPALTRKDRGGDLVVPFGADGMGNKDFAPAVSNGVSIFSPGTQTINLDEIEIPDEVIALVKREIALRYRIVPVSRQGSKLVVAITDPSDVSVLDDIRFATGFVEVEALVASEEAIRGALLKYYQISDEDEDDVSLDDIVVSGGALDNEANSDLDPAELERRVSEGPVVRFVNRILAEAVYRSASDIHIEPYEKVLRIRFCLDGVLADRMRMRLSDNREFAAAVVSRIKVMSNLKLDERRLPQGGRLRLTFGKGSKKREVDFRVSIIPASFGESVALRILDTGALVLNLEGLGFDDDQLAIFQAAISNPWGIILVTGPTGSGKSTTLYSALSKIDRGRLKVVTVEDPVEILLPDIVQVQVDERIGRTFENVLREFLRQAPNVMMVGEIRDFETAQTAVKAAATGHLIFSTLHTNDAVSTIYRLLDMGIEPFFVVSSLILVLAQRLLRKNCKHCLAPEDVGQLTISGLGLSDEKLARLNPKKGRGCSKCNNTGYKGRTVCAEILVLTREIQEAILRRDSIGELQDLAKRLEMKTMRDVALERVKQGITSLEEVLRVVK